MKAALPILTGCLLIASFPRADQGYLAWFAFIPLIAFVSCTTSAKSAFWAGFATGFLQVFVLLRWMPAVLVRYGGLSAFLAWVAYTLLACVLACYPAVACGLCKYLIRRAGEAFILLFPFIWILFEYAQSFSPFGGLPWLMAGYSQSKFLGVIQIADITGIYGISFLIVWTGAAVYWLFRRKGRDVSAWAPAGVALILIIFCIVYARISFGRWGYAAPRFKVAMLQGNLLFEDSDSVLREKFLQGYLHLADRLGGADLLLLPESPSPVYFESNPGYRKMVGQLARRFSLGLVFNNVRHVERGAESEYFNTAYFMDSNGVLKGVYDKVHLVPFGEYLPWTGLFSFVEVISKDVGSFSSGNDYQVVRIGDHPANAIICFEAVFPNLVRRFVRDGSELIVNLTNDGWYGDSAAPYQHLAIARLRAVENRRFLLRATNSGISAIIEPTGRIQSSTGLLQESTLEGRFDFISSGSFYTRHGDVFVFLCAIISSASVIFAGLRKARIHKPTGTEEE